MATARISAGPSSAALASGSAPRSRVMVSRSRSSDPTMRLVAPSATRVPKAVPSAIVTSSAALVCWARSLISARPASLSLATITSARRLAALNRSNSALPKRWSGPTSPRRRAATDGSANATSQRSPVLAMSSSAAAAPGRWTSCLRA
jgi:hypothetical protein